MPTFKRFLSTDCDLPDIITLRLHDIHEEDITQDPFTEDELEKLLGQYPTNERIDQSTLTIPPVNFSQNPICHHNSIFPLLLSPIVRSRLQSCLPFSKEVKISLHHYTIEIFDYRNSIADIFFLHSQAKAFIDSWMDNGLRRLFSTFLSSFSAAMFHSSGIIKNKNSALFFAPDEGGKTTLQSLCPPGEQRLSDDRNIVRKKGDSFFAYTTPWGSIGDPCAKGEIGALFLLEKADDFSITPITSQEIFSFIWNEHAFLWESYPPAQKSLIFNLITDLCYSIKGYQLKFNKTKIDWTSIEQVL